MDEPSQTIDSHPICPDPVFVMGSPRSGTTVLAWALAQHGQFWTCEETQILWDLLSDGRLLKNYSRRTQKPNDSWLHNHGIAPAEYLRHIGLGINALFTRQSEGRRWIDHAPSHALFADALLDMFPGARFVHVLRSGQRTVHSMINYPTKSALWSRDFHDASRTWATYVSKAMEFEATHPDRCLTIRNEELTADPDKSFDRVFAFLGAGPEKAAARYYRTTRPNSSFAVTPGVAIDQSPPPWEAWSHVQREVFLAEAGELEERLYRRPGASVRDAIAQMLPQDAVVLVINRGDDGLLKLSGRRALPFPQDESGDYAGHYPGDSAEAIRHLQDLCARGATHLLLPSTSFWWLEFYQGFKDHLETRCRRVFGDAAYALFALGTGNGER